MNVVAGANSLTFDDPPALAGADSFAAFVERNTQLAYRVAFARLRNPTTAEDAVQDSFLKLMAKDRWRAAENERAFVATTVWRVAGDLGRSARAVHQTKVSVALAQSHLAGCPRNEIRCDLSAMVGNRLYVIILRDNALNPRAHRGKHMT